MEDDEKKPNIAVDALRAHAAAIVPITDESVVRYDLDRSVEEIEEEAYGRGCKETHDLFLSDVTNALEGRGPGSTASPWDRAMNDVAGLYRLSKVECKTRLDEPGEIDHWSRRLYAAWCNKALEDIDVNQWYRVRVLFNDIAAEAIRLAKERA